MTEIFLLFPDLLLMELMDPQWPFITSINSFYIASCVWLLDFFIFNTELETSHKVINTLMAKILRDVSSYFSAEGKEN
jgi:hypothetical protein